MKKLRAHVKNLVAMELRLANDNFPLFRSDHEAVGVIEEEMIEAQAEAKNVWTMFNEFRDSVFNDWNEEKEKAIDALKDNAIEAACEYIQVAAMAKKWKQGKEFSQEHADYLAKTCPEADMPFTYKQLKTMLEEMHKEDEDAE